MYDPAKIRKATIQEKRECMLTIVEGEHCCGFLSIRCTDSPIYFLPCECATKYHGVCRQHIFSGKIFEKDLINIED